MVDPDYDGEHDDETTEDDRPLYALIDDLLAEERADRYTADDRSWQDPIVDKVAGILTQQDIQESIDDLARRYVRSREGHAVRHLRGKLREIYDTAQLPFGWGEADWRAVHHNLLRLPLAIGHERVCFGAATPADWQQWVDETQEAADQRAAADVRTINGGRLLMQWMTDQSVQRVENLHQVDDQ